MEHEEKILHMLQAMQEQMKAIQQEVSELKQERQAMQEQIAQLEKAKEETEQRIADTEKSIDNVIHDVLDMAQYLKKRIDKHYDQFQELVGVDGKLIKRIERLESDVRLAKGAAANAMVNSWKL